MVAADALRGHAANLDALRERFAAIRAAGRQITRDQAAFGSLCGWILTGMEDRGARQNEILARVEENLHLVVVGLQQVADGEVTLAEMVGGDKDAADPPAIAEVVDKLSALVDGDRAAPSLLHRVNKSVRSREWIDSLLAEAVPFAESLAVAPGRVAVARAAALAWAEESIAGLRRMLEDLAGMPGLVAAQAEAWTVSARELRSVGADLWWHLRADLPTGDEPVPDEYLILMAHNIRGIFGLADVAEAMSLITRAAGEVIGLTRDVVCGLIAALVGAVVGWVTESATGEAGVVVPPPVTLFRLAIVVAGSWHIDAYLNALVKSVAALSMYLDG